MCYVLSHVQDCTNTWSLIENRDRFTQKKKKSLHWDERGHGAGNFYWISIREKYLRLIRRDAALNLNDLDIVQGAGSALCPWSWIAEKYRADQSYR